VISVKKTAIITENLSKGCIENSSVIVAVTKKLLNLACRFSKERLSIYMTKNTKDKRVSAFTKNSPSEIFKNLRVFANILGYNK
jgi:hypothetical protein